MQTSTPREHVVSINSTSEEVRSCVPAGSIPGGITDVSINSTSEEVRSFLVVG